MNGKIKTKFAALFAVALMITVCVVPVVGNEDVQAASAAPEGVSGIEIQLFTEDSTDFSDMVYFNVDNKLPETLDATEWRNYADLWININEKSEYFGKFLRWGQVDVDNDEIIAKMGNALPMIQTSYTATENHEINVEVNGTTKDNGSVKTYVQLAGGDIFFGEREVISSIKFLASGGNENLGINDRESLVGGNYEVEVYINNTLAASDLLVFETDNDLVELKGKVQDAKKNTIDGAVVAYTIDGNSKTVKTKDGIYTITAKPGSIVNITGVTYEDGAFTFDKTYSYGTISNVDVPVSPDNTFTAKETMGVATVSKSTHKISGASVSISWWYQTGTGTTDDPYVISTDAPSGVTEAGTVTVLGKTNDKGEVLFSYVEPTVDNTVICELIANVSNVTGFTFTKKSPDATTTESMSENIASASGTKIVELSDTDSEKASVSFSPAESIGTITVSSKNGEDIVGAEVKMKWWYQTGTGTTDDPYVVKEDAPTSVTKAGTVTVLGKTNDDGEALFTFTNPTPSQSGVLIADVYDVNGYTFTNKSPDAEAGKSINQNISGATGTKAVTTTGTVSVSFSAKENSYSVSGTINATGVSIPEGSKYLPTVTITYTNGVGSTVVLDKEKTSYSYRFQVIEGNSTTVSVSLDGYEFTPASFTTPSLYDDYVLDFTGKSTAEVMDYVMPVLSSTSWTVNDLIKLKGESISFAYTVDGVEYLTPVLVNQSGVATFTPSYITGIPALNSVSAEGYNIDLSTGSAVTTVVTPVKFFFYSGSINVPVAGLELTIMNAGEVAGTIITDENGVASLDIAGLGSLTAIYNGVYEIDLAPVTGASEYNGADVAPWIPVAKVTVQYISSVNNSDVVGGAVGGLPVADASYKLAVLPGESVALKAPSIDNFEFVAWMVDGVVVSESADYTLKVDGNCHVDALYSAVHYEEPAEGLSMNVLVIGIVILILGILAVAYGIISKKQ